jgi:aryl-alcohol dehydrogenase-like predicted oxidoreductase
MKYAFLGKTGLQVSRLSLGSWLTIGDQLDFNASKEIIHAAYNHGINLFETAGSYAYGAAEETLGQSLKDLPRQEIILASKCYFPTTEITQSPHRTGLTRKHIIDCVEESLKRLQVEYIDIYQCHRFDSNVPLELIVETFSDLIIQGKILHWGVSKWSLKSIENSLNLTPRLSDHIVSQQDLFNLFHSEPISDFDRLEKLGVSFLTYSPLARGVLTGKYIDGVTKNTRAYQFPETVYDISEEKNEMSKEFIKIAKNWGYESAELAYAWCLSFPQVTSVICGVTNLQQLEVAVKSLAITLENNQIIELTNLFGIQS